MLANKMGKSYATTFQYEFLNTFYWVKQIYPIVFFSSFVYVAILVLNLCGLYKLETSNPIIILGYISLIHFFSYPLFQFGLNGNAVCLLIFPYINLIWIVAVVICHFVMFVAFHEKAIKINDDVPIHYHFAAAYFINSLVLELLLIFFKTQEMRKLKVAMETQDSDEARSDKFSEKFAEKFVTAPHKEAGAAENAFHTISLGNQNQLPEVTVPKEATAVMQAREEANPFLEQRHQTERKLSNGKASTQKIEFDKFGRPSNKEQATNLIEAQNSIRNIINKRSDRK